MKYFILLLLCYLIGSIPFGYFVGKHLKGIDIREYGSGNIGVANSFRIMGTRYALIVLLGDCLKGFFSIILSRWILVEQIEFYLLIGLVTIIGHNWSAFLRFKGGKGIATTYGVVLAFYPLIAITGAIIWGTIVLATKLAALGSIISVLSMFALSFLFKTPIEFKVFMIFIVLFALIRHRSNILRLIQKKENTIN